MFKTYMSRVLLIAGLVLCGTPLTGRAQALEPTVFAQQFYDWYAPLAVRDTAGPTWMAALRARPDLFDIALTKALTADAAAQAKEPNDIVGLDFDPFLCSQDPELHYQVLGSHVDGSDVQVDVTDHGSQPHVVMVLRRAGAAWRIVDFRYPDFHTNLLILLKQIQYGLKK